MAAGSGWNQRRNPSLDPPGSGTNLESNFPEKELPDTPVLASRKRFFSIRSFLLFRPRRAGSQVCPIAASGGHIFIRSLCNLVPFLRHRYASVFTVATVRMGPWYGLSLSAVARSADRRYGRLSSALRTPGTRQVTEHCVAAGTMPPAS